jgi:hypothetical protein
MSRREILVSHARLADDRGAALILTLIVSVLLAALGLGLVALTNVEGSISHNGRDTAASNYAAEAVLAHAIRELRQIPAWSDALSGAAVSAFTDGVHSPTTSFGQVIDLDAVTLELTTASGSGGAWGADAPSWRLFSWGPLDRLTGGAGESPAYLAVWIADDTAETDGAAVVDTNGLISLYAAAFGPQSGRRAIQASLARVWQLSEPVTGPFLPGPDTATRCFRVGCYDSGSRYWPPGLVPSGTPATPGVVRLLSWREAR